MGKKSDAGLAARQGGRPYHTRSDEDHPVYHNRPDCPDGLDIELKNLRGGPGKGHRALCEKCAGLAST